jgi:spore maturation protein CgeB
MLLADRTDEHRGFFKESEEADFFSSCDELVDKVKFYCGHESVRERLARNGYKRCIENGYAYVHRLRAALETIPQL